MQLSANKSWEQLYPEKRGATATIITYDGETCSAEVELAKGEPENPASWEEIYKKFYANSTLLISEKEAKKLGHIIMDLEHSSLGDLIELL